MPFFLYINNYLENDTNYTKTCNIFKYLKKKVKANNSIKVVSP